jgi:hypothetical protein
MRPAERIPLLKKLATALSGEDAPWAETELTLRQFGFAYTDERVWENGYDIGPSLYEVVLGHLEHSGTDEGLLELERYLGVADGQSPTPTPTPTSAASTDSALWKEEGGSTFRLFISHTHPNAAFAAAIKKYLQRFLIESFVAHDDIEPSKRWIRVIESALLTCHAGIAIITPDFRESQWCDQEVGFLLARSLVVVPLMRGPDPHGFLSEVQGIKLKPNTSAQRAGDDVLRILASSDETRDRVAPSVVRFYAASKNFDNARQACRLLGRIPKEAWTPEMVHEVERAAEDNYQVKAANLSSGATVPEAVDKILAPIKRRLAIDDPPVPFGP